MGNVWIALGLTVFAGMATGIGSALAFFAKRTDHRFLAVSTGFSAGVMLYVSFVEIFYKGVDSLVEVYGDPGGHWVTVAAFFGGIVVIGLIDNLIPSAENPHEVRTKAAVNPLKDSSDQVRLDEAERSSEGPVNKTTSDAGSPDTGNSDLLRMGLFTALAIGIHNFPEGLATFAAALSDVKLGAFIALAIAIHNIPEGIAVSVPIFYATGSRNKAFAYSFLSGVSEPVGALLGFLVLMPFLNETVLAATLAFVAGVMIYISLDELLPTAHRYGHGHLVIGGVVLGMLIMAASLLML